MHFELKVSQGSLKCQTVSNKTTLKQYVTLIYGLEKVISVTYNFVS